jgi:hypothetical protein
MEPYSVAFQEIDRDPNRLLLASICQICADDVDSP